MTSPEAPIPATPILAATTLLLRDGAAGIEVLMITRPSNASFAAGALVFPGGAVDPGDSVPEMLACGASLPAIDAAALAIRVAAIRETFEECGILLARRRGRPESHGPGPLLRASEVAALRETLRRRLGRDPSLAELAAEGGLELATDRLVPYAHWITPADRPKRFDAHFFLAAAPAEQEAQHDGREAVHSVWIRPAEAVAEADAGRAGLVLATRINLLKLARSGDVASALAAAPKGPIATVVPVHAETPSGPVFRIPAEAGYGLTEVPDRGIRRS